MDAESTKIWISIVFAKAMQWGFFEFVLALLVTIAAWRYRMVGVWLLAAAAILRFLASLWLMVLIQHGGGPHSFQIVSIPNILATVLAIGGWSVLAFCHSKKLKADA